MAHALRWPPPLVRLPGAEVVAAAGEAARCRGGCRCWQAVGAEVVAAAGEPLGASYPRDRTGVEVVHTCRVEMELGLRLKADVILLLFVRYF
jgi:hypothetical protein